MQDLCITPLNHCAYSYRMKECNCNCFRIEWGYKEIFPHCLQRLAQAVDFIAEMPTSGNLNVDMGDT